MDAIAYLPDRQIGPLLEQARKSIASLSGPAVEELARDQVRQLRDCNARQKRLEGQLVTAYRGLDRPNHLDTIPGIGAVSAAVLTAFVGDIGRFEDAGKLVAYFGVLPIEVSSGVDRDGQPRLAAVRHEPARQRPGADVRAGSGGSQVGREEGRLTGTVEAPQHQRARYLGRAVRGTRTPWLIGQENPVITADRP